MEIDPLLKRLTDLAPRFGRISPDIDTMVSRGRTGDYKGVMQNARLVLEALLRSLITDELKQTPGKAMLDELVSKFRQQSNAGIIPTNILAHMGTVQAWGNLSSHDHAGSLTDEGVKVGREEVVASLNSMAAILAWYADKRGLAPAATPGAEAGSAAASPGPGAAQPGGPAHALGPAHTAASSSVAAPPRRTGLVVGAAAVVVIVVGATAAVLLMPPSPEGPTDPPKPPAAAGGFEGLDSLYASWKEPAPPPSCRSAADGPQLAKVATDAASLSVIDKPGPEAAFLLARAVFEGRQQRSPALEAALACQGFAAAEHLAGRIALKEARELSGEAQRAKYDDALARFAAAATAAPKFLKPRMSRAAILAGAGRLEDALVEINAVVAADPDSGKAYLVRSGIHQQLSRLPEAKKDCERAVTLGAEQAKETCALLLSPAP